MAEQPNNITFVTTDSESEENAFELGIKDIFNLSVARWWWLDTPYAGLAYHVRHVITDGSLDYDGADYSTGVAPACVIY